MSRCWLALFVVGVIVVGRADGDEIPPGKPVPAMQVLPLPRSEASIQREGRELSRYVFDDSLKRPFLYPIVGPSGRSLTRMGHPRDPNGHSHHNSVWISHHGVGGVDFWGDGGRGRIVQRRVLQYEDSDEEALIQVENEWLGVETPGEKGRPLLKECRSLRVRPLSGDEWLLVIDLAISPAGSEPITLEKTPFGMIGVRMAKTIGVHDGGGTIRNSQGDVNEKEVFWKPAKWVDYSGPIAPKTVEGITLMDHPSNPNHPNVFHVREDGWMGVSATFAEDRTVGPDETLKLRYGLYVHAGAPSLEALNERFAAFAEIGDPPAKK
jgi:hypothetical protein